MKENVYVFQEETFNAIDDPDNGLDFEDKGMLYTAIFRYAFRGEPDPFLSGKVRLAYSLICLQIDAERGSREDEKGRRTNATQF